MRTASPSLIRGDTFSHRSGQEQQPGADFEMGRFGGAQVDIEANPVSFEVEAYHPTD
jgi:hypothetical protein